MTKPIIGIQANLITTDQGTRGGVKNPRFDPRGTAKVEATRAPGNGKPYRPGPMKDAALGTAEKHKKGKWRGTYVSHAPRIVRDMVPPNVSPQYRT